MASGSASGFDLGRLEQSYLCHLVSLSPGWSDVEMSRKSASFKNNAGHAWTQRRLVATGDGLGMGVTSSLSGVRTEEQVLHLGGDQIQK